MPRVPTKAGGVMPVHTLNILATKRVCRHCGSTLIVTDNDGRYCLLCCRPYTDQQDYGRMGGIATRDRYGIKHFRENGKKGGRPKTKNLAEARRQLAPEAQNQVREGLAARPNNLKVLKELYAAKLKEGEARVSSEG